MITSSVVEAVLDAVASEASVPRHSLAFELQDDGQFILVVLPVNTAMTSTELTFALKRIQAQLIHLVPDRVGELSWMVNAVRGGTVTDSIFGGDARMPDAGLL